MNSYLTPGSYTEDSKRGQSAIQSPSVLTGSFVGISVRGVLNKPVLVTSWQNFLDTFALGMDTPFLANSDLAYAVYGFFQNGGKQCYVVRTAHSTAQKSSTAVTAGKATFTAKDEGTWGDKLSMSVVADTDIATNFDIIVKYDGIVIEKFENVTNTVTDTNYFGDVIKYDSNFISFVDGSGTIAVTGGTDSTFTGGNDGITDIADADYISSLNTLKTVNQVLLIAIPGQTSAEMTNAILKFVDDSNTSFAILDGDKTATPESIIAFRKTLTDERASLYYPWIRVSDPLSNRGKLRDCPTCGHIMGIYSRILTNRGIWKEPAGVEAFVYGAVDVVTQLTEADTNSLCPADVNPLIVMPNIGVVVWGSKLINSNPKTKEDIKYNSDALMNLSIKNACQTGTQWAVFEPNNKILWDKIKVQIEAYLNELWKAGGLKGNTPEEAYFVKCDSENNTENTIKAGMCYCDIGYAKVAPTEFIVNRISHTMTNA